MPRALICLLLLLSAGLPQRGIAETPTMLAIGYLSLAGDPRYREQRSYANIVLRPAIDPFQGAETAIKEGRILGRAVKIAFRLERVEGGSVEELTAGLEALYRDRRTRIFVVDAPGEMVADLAQRTRGRDVILFNVSAPDDELRGALCAPQLFHTAPSQAMLNDALAQYLRSKAWSDILVLQGPAPQDRSLAETFARSAKRFGVRIVAVRPFTLSNDPRERDKNNILLLTGGASYDAVFVADSSGQFGRYVPFQTAAPRPVIGSAGLAAGAWHWSWERHGAPQLNQRFDRTAKRRMTGTDWAAWMAVRVVIEAAARTASAEIERLASYIRDEALSLDGYKGTPGSFRAWDNQLRQPILLHSQDAVIARAPIEGFLHPTSYLDTLGVDGSESACRF